ncbi:MAG TPA: SYNERG-CTERM system CAAX-type protease [Synergistaceae bacterium]|nr:SYNERG-CTERM system CAAX-type protease [Synergistaceae bacterium]HPJ26751.1 SYNERG-CTERM system CAAX-type protease [Synergistaceae bacterium]HPQ38489.1 SYNERG-CTERM system CAAX-type protease [Synergistaceae bacterium]
MTQTLTAIVMLYGPFAWCYFRKEPYESYGLVFRWNREMTLKLLLYCLVSLVPLTVVAMNWPGESLPRSVEMRQLFTFAAAGFTAAVVEEVFFRGFFQTLLRSWLPPLSRVFLSAGVFAASHMFFRTSPLFLATFFPGLFMAWLREEFETITPSIAYHFIGNLWAIWFFPGV